MNRKMRRAQKQKLRADMVPAFRGGMPADTAFIAKRVASLFSESLRCLASGQTAKAVALCDRILSLKPDLPEAHCNRGVALAQLGKLHDAEQAYRQVIALRPDHPEAYSNLGEVLRCLGRLDDADKAVRYAIALQPQFADAFSNLGNTLRERGSLDQAEAAYREAIALRPGFPEAHNNLGTVLVDLGRPQDAESALRQAIAISADTVCTELVKLGFSRQSNRKADEGSKHPDRNAQFEYINSKVIAAQAQQQPVISVDTKKKELVGNFKNGGTDYRPKGDPQRVNVHDFENKKLGKVVPYGVYDVTANTGFVSVGITSDTAEFAVQSIRCWLERMGRQRYPNARELTVTADCGGSNGARVRLWKLELQKLADQTGLVIRVHHYPPGTSKWNKIEHRLFCHITQNWRGRPLTDRLAVVELIGATTTKTGLKVESALDTRSYQKGIKVSKAAMNCLDITGDQFHPEWNYTIRPRHNAKS